MSRRKTVKYTTKEFDPIKATPGSYCSDVRAYLVAHSPITCFQFGQEFKRLVSNPIKDGVPYLNIEPSINYLIPTGIHLDIPEGYVVKVFSRSGLGVKNSILLPHSVGIVDSDYTRELFIPLTVNTKYVFKLEHGMRIAQIAIERDSSIPLEKIDEYTKETERLGGFGHTGVK